MQLNNFGINMHIIQNVIGKAQASLKRNLKAFYAKYFLDDPPVNKHHESSDPVFGSWYSTGGNIVGEAGIPAAYDADKQKSVSFYYNEMELK